MFRCLIKNEGKLKISPLFIIIMFLFVLGDGVYLKLQKGTKMNKTVKTPNHLINEKSPYLLQHAYNPVEWFPWGDEAISKAKREDKPIILSIGYSTCHWCHVMEKESFENERIAQIMNQHYVCIKLDREERPDLDSIYMSAVTALTGSGGWPLNVFLTPDLKPFYGGTYFPAVSKYQMISWPDLLLRISKIWEDPETRKDLISTGNKLEKYLKTHLSASGSFNSKEVPELRAMDAGFSHYISQHDNQFGGFGSAPKFPSPVIQNFLMVYYKHLRNHDAPPEDQAKALSLVTTSLGAMADGGIHDHLGGGFHRYSTDKKWHVPHFEKMLYDNAQLISNYLDAYLITKNENFRTVAIQTANYVVRDMQQHEGGFYSAEDADSLPWDKPDSSEKVEGAFYVWDFQEIENLLDEKIRNVVSYHYGLKPDGNVEHDPHGEFTGKNILFKAHSIKETARRFGMEEIGVYETLGKAGEKMFQERTSRPHPHLDDKILVSWNGLMISALSRAYQVLEDDRYLNAAQNAAAFIREQMYDSHKKQLFRRWRQKEKKYFGLAEDYAFLVQGLIDLYESDFNLEWIIWAKELTELQIAKFYDKENGGFFMTQKAHDPHLILRVKEEIDSVIPSTNSVSAINLMRLSNFFNRNDLSDFAKQTISFFYGKLNQSPAAMPNMLVALNMMLSKPVHVIIVKDESKNGGNTLLKEVRSNYIPGKVVIQIDNDPDRIEMAKHLPFIKEMKPIGGLPTAYLCSDFSCQAPTTDPLELGRMLKG